MNRLSLPPVVALALVSFLFPVGCRTADGGGVDWPRVATEMELGAADLRDAAALLTDEDFAAELLKLAALLDNVSLALTIAGEPRDSLEALEAALALADQLVDRLPDDDQGDARVVISLIRSGLRRAKAYAEEAPALPLD